MPIETRNTFLLDIMCQDVLDRNLFIYTKHGTEIWKQVMMDLPAPYPELAERLYIAPQAPDRFNPKVSAQTCGIIQKLYETKHIETMTFGKSVMGHFSKIEPKTSK